MYIVITNGQVIYFIMQHVKGSDSLIIIIIIIIIFFNNKLTSATSTQYRQWTI